MKIGAIWTLKSLGGLMFVCVRIIYSCRFMVCLCKVGSTWGTTMWTLVYCVLWHSNILQSVNPLNTCSTIVGFHCIYTSTLCILPSWLLHIVELTQKCRHYPIEYNMLGPPTGPCEQYPQSLHMHAQYHAEIVCTLVWCLINL